MKIRCYHWLQKGAEMLWPFVVVGGIIAGAITIGRVVRALKEEE